MLTLWDLTQVSPPQTSYQYLPCFTPPPPLHFPVGGLESGLSTSALLISGQLGAEWLFLVRVCLVHCRMSRGTSDLYPWDVSSFRWPVLTTKNVSKHYQMPVGEQNVPHPQQNHWVRASLLCTHTDTSVERQTFSSSSFRSHHKHHFFTPGKVSKQLNAFQFLCVAFMRRAMGNSYICSSFLCSPDFFLLLFPICILPYTKNNKRKKIQFLPQTSSSSWGKVWGRNRNT